MRALRGLSLCKDLENKILVVPYILNFIEMKTLKILFIAVLAIGSLQFMGCEKEDIISESSTNSEISTKAVSASGWGLNNMWNPKFGYCTRLAYDCFDDVDIVADKIWNKVDKWIKEGEWNAPYYLDIDIHKAPAELERYVRAEDVKTAMKNNLSISAYVNEKTNTVYLIFSEAKTKKTAFVYPFVVKK
ncbi:hypothetical protein LJC11_04955 [Bacteroidales bacterium OttesenSCG-928-I21]|nr:hypothetical protein [Bacteroidales bacterium OttesenSCG-928-I21]